MPLNSSVQENGDIIIAVNDNLTIENAADFARLARESLGAAASVIVEFGESVAMDITGVQILCSACKSAAAGGKAFLCQGLLPQGLAEIITASGAERRAACKHYNDSNCIWFGGAQ